MSRTSSGGVIVSVTRVHRSERQELLTSDKNIGLAESQELNYLPLRLTSPRSWSPTRWSRKGRASRIETVQATSKSGDRCEAGRSQAKERRRSLSQEPNGKLGTHIPHFHLRLRRSPESHTRQIVRKQDPTKNASCRPSGDEKAINLAPSYDHCQNDEHGPQDDERTNCAGLSPNVPVDHSRSRRYKLHQRQLRVSLGDGGSARQISTDKQGSFINVPSIQLEHNDYASSKDCAPLATYCVLTTSPLALERYVSDQRGKICATILKSGDQHRCKYRICAPPMGPKDSEVGASKDHRPCLLTPLAEVEAFVKRTSDKLESRSRWSWSKLRSMRRKSRSEKDENVDPSSVVDLYPSGSVLELRMTVPNESGENEIYSANHTVPSIVRQTKRPPNGCTIWRTHDAGGSGCDSSSVSSTSSVSAKENCARLTLCSGTERELWIRRGVDPCLIMCFVAIIDEVMFEICYQD